jgi:MscS family membrane protein
MQEFLSMEIAGRSASAWIIAVAWILGGFLSGKIVAWFSSSVLKRFAAKTRTRLDDLLLAFIEKPFVFIITLTAIRLSVDSLDFHDTVLVWIDKVFLVLIAAAVAWAVSRVLDTIIEEYFIPLVNKSEGTLDDQLLPIIRKGVKIAVWSVALLIALKNAGYDVGALLAGLGIGGVAVALAAKDTLSNFFGSVAVFIDRPFHINDRIKVSGFDGNVVEIGIRTSRLKTLDGRIVTLPNAIFAASPIENVSSEPSAKVSATVDLAHSVGSGGAGRASLAIKEALSSVPGLAEGSMAGVSGINEFGIRVSYFFFVEKTSPYAERVSAAHLAVLKALEAEGIPLALSQRVTIGRS